MRAIISVLALVGFLPQFCSTTKSIHDWAHELGNKLGPGYSFREVERNGRACICSTTTQFSTATIPASTTVAGPSASAGETTVEQAATTTVGEDVTTTTEAGSTEAELEPSTTVAEPSTSEEAPTTTQAQSTSPEEQPTTTEEPAVHTTSFEIEPSTSAAVETTAPSGVDTSTYSSVFFGGIVFGARGFSCDDNVVPAVNDRNAATKYSFSTPLYPEEYPEGICCTWRIVYPEAWLRHTTAKIITYNYSPDSYLPEDCDSDFITVYDIAANNRLIEREQKCGHIGGQLGIIKHDSDERGAAFRVCKDEERSHELKKTEPASRGKVAVSFTVVAF